MRRHASPQVGVVAELEGRRPFPVQIILAADSDVQVVPTDAAAQNVPGRNAVDRCVDEMGTAARIFRAIKLRRILKPCVQVESLVHEDFRVDSEA